MPGSSRTMGARATALSALIDGFRRHQMPRRVSDGLQVIEQHHLLVVELAGKRRRLEVPDRFVRCPRPSLTGPAMSKPAELGFPPVSAKMSMTSAASPAKSELLISCSASYLRRPVPWIRAPAVR